MLEIPWTEATDWVADHQDFVFITTIGAALCLLAIPWDWLTNWAWLNVVPRRRGKVTKRARRIYVESDATYGFTDYIETRVYHGDYSRKEAIELYRKLKLCFPVRELFPQQALLKENIQKRIASGIHAPVKLPDSKNGKKGRNLFTRK